MKRKFYPVILSMILAFLAGFGLSHFQAPPVAHADLGIGGAIALPAINHTGDVQAAGISVVIQVQNLGITNTQVALFLWPLYTGYCEPQVPGPQKLECSGIIQPGSAWVWTGQQLPAWAASGTVTAVKVGSCSYITPTLAAALGRDPVFLPPAPIPPLAVDVTRRAPGDVSPEVLVSASYGGLNVPQVSIGDPVFGGFSYYAPTVMVNALGFNSRIYLQNLGDECTSVEVWLRAEDDCLRAQICEVMALAPGETYILDSARCVGGPFRGSAWIRTTQPMAVLIEIVGQDTLTSYAGVASHVTAGQVTTPSGSRINYGPLIFREFQGWETTVTVQNMSGIYNAAVKVYFLDASGDIITTIVDWVCPRGSQTFFLPVINGLPGNYVGAVRVESLDTLTYGPPNITSVATLTKFEGPARAQALEAIGYNLPTEQESFNWYLGCSPESPQWPDCYPGVGLIGVPSLMKSHLGVSSELAIHNINPNPGFTDFAIFFFDQNGLVNYVCQKLNEKQVEYIDLDTWGYIPPGFMGSAVISATYTTQPGGFGLAAVIVERMGPTLVGDIPGDESNGHAAIPFAGTLGFQGAWEPVCPGFECNRMMVTGFVYDSVTGLPIRGAHVVLSPGGHKTYTNDNGWFIITNVRSPGRYTLTINAGANYEVYQTNWRVECNQNLEVGTLQVRPLLDITGVAHKGDACKPAPTDARYANRRVELWQGDRLVNSTQTNSEGYFEFENLPADSYHLKIIFDNLSYPSADINLDSNQTWNFNGHNVWCRVGSP